MEPFSRLICVTALALLAGCTPKTLTVEPPPIQAAGATELSPTGLVTDAAGILSDEERESLTEKLADVGATTGHLVLVVTVPSLTGEDIATYTEKLANRWGVGRESGYDGVVLLLAMQERRARVATGQGLVAELPDAYTQRVMDEQIIQRFRQGDLYGGIDAGLDAIIAVLKADRG